MCRPGAFAFQQSQAVGFGPNKGESVFGNKEPEPGLVQMARGPEDRKAEVDREDSVYHRDFEHRDPYMFDQGQN